MLVAGLYLLARFNRLLVRQFKNELIRKNIVVWMIAMCLAFSLLPTNPELYKAISDKNLLQFFLTQCLGVTIEVLFVFNVLWIVVKYINKKKISFRKRMAVILLPLFFL
jgi:hypothetical protein